MAYTAFGPAIPVKLLDAAWDACSTRSLNGIPNYDEFEAVLYQLNHHLADLLDGAFDQLEAYFFNREYLALCEGREHVRKHSPKLKPKKRKKTAPVLDLEGDANA